MSSIVENIHRCRSAALPVSQSAGGGVEQGLLRRRMSSLSLNLQPIASPARTWAIHRSKSLSAMGQNAGESVKSWWEWGWGWILSKKPVFAQDLEMKEEESKALGSSNRGSWRHIVYKVRSEIRKVIVRSDKVGLPQSYRYDSYNYARNFDSK